MTVARADTLRSKAFGTITNAYTTLGAVITNNWRAFKISNTTNADMLISFDGSTDNLIIPASSFTLYDLAANSAPATLADSLVIGAQTQLYVKYVTVPSTGTVYAEGIYARRQ